MSRRVVGQRPGQERATAAGVETDSVWRPAQGEEAICTDVGLEVHRQIEARGTPLRGPANELERGCPRCVARQPARVERLDPRHARNEASELLIPAPDHQM